MTTQRTALVVDDDPDHVSMIRSLLEKAGYTVTGETDSLLAMERIEALRPDCVLLDIMMPNLDGLQLCQKIRANPDYAAIKVVIVSAKPYEFDRQRAIRFGADAYFIKPIEPRPFLARLEEVFQDTLQVRFWGVRGTLPVPGPHTVRYGGNTNCVTLHLPKGPMFVFDAGSGIKNLSDHLLAAKKFPMACKILISHPHWDHINGLPFLVPLYIKGNEFEICGANQNGISTRQMISDQMDGVYFPIRIKEFSARVYFRDIQEEQWDVGHGALVSTMLLNHPGICLGYRVDYGGRRVAYITDNELHPPEHPHHNPAYLRKLVRFVEEADMVIIDTTYTDEAYVRHAGWGHSAPRQVAELAHQARVKTLCLFHHDPDQKDADIDAKLAQTRAHLHRLGASCDCVAPAEGSVITL
ncbi:MAG: response regulator [Magnetococcales bacterium]|nr:response regulator [Magnetococcales bacterium]